MAGNHNSGRKRKPLSIHKAQGTYHATKHEHYAEEKELGYGGSPAAPQGLGKDGQWLWDLVTRTTPASILVEVDSATLFACAREWGFYRYHDRMRSRAKEGKDYDRHFRRANDALKNFERLASQFGMSPAARARLKAPSAPSAESDPMADLLGRRDAG